MRQINWLLDQYGALVASSSLIADASRVQVALGIMASDECARFGAFTNPIAARRYALSRVVLRTLLGAATEQEPRTVGIKSGAHGKLHLGEIIGERPLWFSVAHSDDLFMVALSRRSDVGVDVERTRTIRHWERLADRVLAPDEVELLMRETAAGENTSRAFLRRWCRLEARLKLDGLGFSAHQTRDSVASAACITSVDDVPVPESLALVGVHYQAALAIGVSRTA